MSRHRQQNSLVISAAAGLVAATACGSEPTGLIDPAAFQLELAPLSVDTRAQAADISRAVADRALTVTHRLTLRPQPELAAARDSQPKRS